jgi:Fe-S-cluster containining protein
MPKCLSVHADYRCRHSGACCRAGWTIPFSADEFVTASLLPLASGGFRRDEQGHVSAANRTDGACAFLETSALCAIHRLGSSAALPVSCRMFPRVVLHDARGTFISLSHFCPTAASMLCSAAGPVTIVDAPETLTGAGDLDGLDARDAWPPLLRPGVLMDVESYGVWEARAIELLTGDGRPAADALAVLDAVTAAITSWSPGGGALRDAIERAFEGERATLSEAFRPVSSPSAINRWLAARLFANWIAYQGDGLDAIVRYLDRCLATFDAELAVDGDAIQAIRRSDLAILHTVTS